MTTTSPRWLRMIVVVSVLSVAFMAIIDAVVVTQLQRPLTNLVIDPEASCPSAAAGAGIEAYLGQTRRKRQAARVLVQAGRLYDDRRVPPSVFVRTIDYYRASFAAQNLTNREMARLLCGAPVIEVSGGKRVSGVPSVAAEVLNRDIATISDREMFLITCGVMNAERGARRAMMDALTPESAIDALVEICGSP